jgi:hypothetical protein
MKLDNSFLKKTIFWNTKYISLAHWWGRNPRNIIENGAPLINTVHTKIMQHVDPLLSYDSVNNARYYATNF